MGDIIITAGIAVLLCGLFSKIHETAVSRRIRRDYMRSVKGPRRELRKKRKEVEDLYRSGGISADEYMSCLNSIDLELRTLE